MLPIHLRNYQHEAVTAVQLELKNGVRRQLMVLPTASGKTVIMAAVARQFNRRTLILEHRHELIQQTAKTLKRYWPKVSIGICQGEKNDYTAQVVVGSVQSCMQPKRLEQLKSQNFEILMIDETHHAVAASYKLIIDALGFGAGTEKLLLGVTAVPERSDGKQLGTIFDKVIYSRSIGDLITPGFLSPVIGRKVLTRELIKGVKTYVGDFETSSLSRAINTPNRNKLIVESYKTYASGRKAICFCADVKHCHDVAAEFNSQGVKAAAVWGRMLDKQRKKVLNDLRKGRADVVISCGVLTEGFDEPSINSILVARPTKSRSLYIQMAGRGLRTHPGKTNCLVIDFTDEGHVLKNALSLTNAIPEARVIQDEQEITEKTPQEKTVAPNCALEQPRSYPWDILGNNTMRLIWVAGSNDECVLLDDDRNEIVIQPANGGFRAVFYLHGENNGVALIHAATSLEKCIRWCEEYAIKHLTVNCASVQMLNKLQSQMPTSRQIQWLTERGISTEGLDKAQAAFIIRSLVIKHNKERRHALQETRSQREMSLCYPAGSTQMMPNNKCSCNKCSIGAQR
ncbi:MAG: DEAD/DEAH box helicase [Candidatus Babeliales bacterium]|jgi:superfamily II DNA or RNA helicase